MGFYFAKEAPEYSKLFVISSGQMIEVLLGSEEINWVIIFTLYRRLPLFKEIEYRKINLKID